jgi:CRP/FNR family cyclic AMP-dependent transcriptional regulator
MSATRLLPMNDELAALLSVAFPEVAIPSAAAEALARLVRVRRVPGGGLVFAQGEPTTALHGVLAGEVEARLIAADGQASVLEHVGAGGLFGLASFASGLPSTYEAVATRPSRLALFGPAAYGVLMDGVPGAARLLLGELARRHDGTLKMLAAARHLGAIERFSLVLAQLRREGRLQKADDAGWRFLRATQAELAALAGLSRQTVNEVVAQLVRKGRLRTGYGGLWLPP